MAMAATVLASAAIAGVGWKYFLTSSPREQEQSQKGEQCGGSPATMKKDDGNNKKNHKNQAAEAVMRTVLLTVAMLLGLGVAMLFKQLLKCNAECRQHEKRAALMTASLHHHMSRMAPENEKACKDDYLSFRAGHLQEINREWQSAAAPPHALSEAHERDGKHVRFEHVDPVKPAVSATWSKDGDPHCHALADPLSDDAIQREIELRAASDVMEAAIFQSPAMPVAQVVASAIEHEPLQQSPVPPPLSEHPATDAPVDDVVVAALMLDTQCAPPTDDMPALEHVRDDQPTEAEVPRQEDIPTTSPSEAEGEGGVLDSLD
jgi:hypothetical protein